MGPVRLAVAGAGVIGKRHIEEVDASRDATLASVVDPGPVGPELAAKYGVPLYQSLAELFERDEPDGVILATPNQIHVDGGLECVVRLEVGRSRKSRLRVAAQRRATPFNANATSSASRWVSSGYWHCSTSIRYEATRLGGAPRLMHSAPA